MLAKIFDPFIRKRPICVMARGVLERLWKPEHLDSLFDEVSERQYTRSLSFSRLVHLMGQVVLNLQPSVHAAYQAQSEEMEVSARAVYDKLSGVEPAVSAALVEDAAREARPVIEALGACRQPLLPGYRTKVLDGNHFSAVEHRLKELRTTWAAPLPGKALVLFDQETGLLERMWPEEDGQAQERSSLAEVLPCIAEGMLYLADRNFCTIGFCHGIDSRRAAFVIRQHGRLKGTSLGEAVAQGRSETGEVFEEKLHIKNEECEVTVRRITVVLDKPTRDGDTEVHLLTNVPSEQATAIELAELYRKRWTIERVFQQLTEMLTAEVRTLAYPRAALFAFALALTAYNAVVLLRAALEAAHGRETIADTVSGYYLALEIAQTYDGMMIAVPAENWHVFGALPTEVLAEELTHIAAQARLSRYKKHSRGPKKPPPERAPYENGAHVATAKILAQRKRKP